MDRLRIRFTKLGKIRWTSHRDVARMWERAFRRVELPLAYSSGFSPRPKVSFGLALPTGHESVAEYLDLETTDEDLDIRALPARLSAALPSGLDATAAAWIPPGTASLQEDVAFCTWRWAAVPADGAEAVEEAEMAARVATLLACSEVVVTRPRKGIPVTDDIRAGIFNLCVLEPTGAGLAAAPELGPLSHVWLQADLASKPRSLRPSEVLAGLGADLEERDTRRLHQWILRDGAREEPLLADGPLGATDAPHAWERAS